MVRFIMAIDDAPISSAIIIREIGDYNRLDPSTWTTNENLKFGVIKGGEGISLVSAVEKDDWLNNIAERIARAALEIAESVGADNTNTVVGIETPIAHPSIRKVKSISNVQSSNPFQTMSLSARTWGTQLELYARLNFVFNNVLKYKCLTVTPSEPKIAFGLTGNSKKEILTSHITSRVWVELAQPMLLYGATKAKKLSQRTIEDLADARAIWEAVYLKVQGDENGNSTY